MTERPATPKPVYVISLLILIWLAYSSGLRASWHLDDYQNIVRNEKLHVNRLDADSLAGTFFAGTSDKVYRPIPMLSFALNWYIHGADPLGYHIVNIAIHCLNALLLYSIVLNLMRTPRMAGVYEAPEVRWIALLAAMLWALNPVQTQAVTYIVQRMASMAALFYAIGIYLFLQYKRADAAPARILWAVAVVLCYLMAVLSKENAALFPVSLLLIQAIFYSPQAKPAKKHGRWRDVLPMVLVIGSIAVAVFVLEYGSPLTFIDRLYTSRPFSASQRLMTEPRVLVFYLSLLAFPAPWRLSLTHDVALSTSLLHPWTTLPAMVAVFLMIGLGLRFMRQTPLISLACVFFFLNHVVESTILPLELAFEHRNYLPSMFLFVPLACAVIRIWRHPSISKGYGRRILIGCGCLVIGVFGNWTFARNLVWHSERSLWADEMRKNPGLARPYHNLAWAYHQARGEYDEALALYRKALTLTYQSEFERASTLNNIGRILYLKGDYQTALDYFAKSIHAHPHRSLAEYQIVMSLIQLSRWGEALDRVNSALQANEADPFYQKMKGIVLSRRGDDLGAIISFRRSLEAQPEAEDTRVHLSIALSRMGEFDEANRLLAGGVDRAASTPLVLVAMAEIEHRMGNRRASDAIIHRLIKHQGIEKYREMLLAWQNDNLAPDIDYRYYLTRPDQRDIH